MSKENTGVLPTKEKNELNSENKSALAKAYTEHYVNQNSGIKAIIYKHSLLSKGDYNYCDAYKDLEAAAYLIVHKAAIKYVSGSSKSGKKYKDNFDFCKFAGNYLKFGLKKYLYNLNTKRLNGSLPDSDNIRKLYFQLPKNKKEKENQNQSINFDKYKKLSNSIGLESKKIEEIDQTLTTYAISGDKELSDENSETLFDILPDKEKSIEEQTINKDLKKHIKKIKNNILGTFSPRDKEIVTQVKLLENKNIIQLAKKYNLSSERVRQIAENKFLFIINKIKKNLEY
tara:strand:- start:1717 stop:2574 length:858 start_codon:yes stop_codon:yes gene_type:complete